jgi:hypothetical protein
MAIMARPPRIDFPDAVYHVTSRGNGRDVVFWSDADREWFLGQVGRQPPHGAAVGLAWRLGDVPLRGIGGHYGNDLRPSPALRVSVVLARVQYIETGKSY